MAAKAYLTGEHIQSAALMVPCPWYNEMANWYIENPKYDLGLHLSLTSEWKWYRWGPVADRTKVPGLIDNDGYMWRSVQSVILAAKPSEVEEGDSRPDTIVRSRAATKPRPHRHAHGNALRAPGLHPAPI